MMVTHNMKDAIRHGNRLIMMHEGRIIYDVSGEEKKKLTVSDLLEEIRAGKRRRVCQRPDDAGIKLNVRIRRTVVRRIFCVNKC